jgi:stearoyl-CoA desaturase (delta-9 desaturase)
MIWIPLWAAGVINGIGHALGYRNFEVKDESRNISPIAIWLGGEELHNNHHADPKSAKFKAKWFEFDIGWVYIRGLKLLGLAKIEYARNYGSDAKRRDENAVEVVTA